MLEEAFQEEKLKLCPPFSSDAHLDLSSECEAVQTDESPSDSSMESSTGSHSHQTSGSVSSADDVHIDDPYDAIPIVTAQVPCPVFLC